MILALCQLVGGLILTIGVIPQILQVVKTKSAKDINHVSVLTMLAGIMLMEMYAIGLLIEGIVPFFITNTASLLLQSTLAFVVVKNKFFVKKSDQEAVPIIQETMYRGRDIDDLVSSPIESWDQAEVKHVVSWMESISPAFIHSLDERENYIWKLMISSKVNLLSITASLGIMKGQVSRLIKKVMYKAIQFANTETKVG